MTRPYLLPTALVIVLAMNTVASYAPAITYQAKDEWPSFLDSRWVKTNVSLRLHGHEGHNRSQGTACARDHLIVFASPVGVS